MPTKILVVEDNADARRLLATLLKEQGFFVMEAEDGQAALELINGKRPDLIITDIQMPNLDGIEMIKVLRGGQEISSVPVLVMTGNQSGAVTEALKAGADAAARKPVEFGLLIKLIKQLLLPSIAVYLTIGVLYLALCEGLPTCRSAALVVHTLL